MKPSLFLIALVMVLSVLSSGCGCCRIVVDLDSTPDPDDPEDRRNPDDDDNDVSDDGGDDPQPKERGRVHLGHAQFPTKNSARSVEHPWYVPRLEPDKYKLGFKVPGGDAKKIRSGYHLWARGVGHKRIDKSRFQWRPPPGCLGAGLKCVYEELDDGSVDAVETIAELFRQRASKRKLSSLDLASLVITFVQEIKYKIPKNEPFGVKPPALVVREKDGDCDSKTLLAHMILRSIGVRSVIISSNAHAHSMLGVRLPAPGTTFTWKGRKYAFVEMTAKRSPIGHINRKLLRPNDWRVVPMNYKKLGKPTTRVKKPKPKPKKPRGPAEIIKGGRIRINL